MNTIDKFYIMNRTPMRGACHWSPYHKIATFKYLTRSPIDDEIAYAFRIIKY